MLCIGEPASLVGDGGEGGVEFLLWLGGFIIEGEWRVVRSRRGGMLFPELLRVVMLA